MRTNKNKEVLSMTTTAQKWGNSLGVRIPQRIAKKYGVVNGSEIKVTEGEHGIILKPLTTKPTLDELLAQITDENRHNFIDFGREGDELL